MDMHKAILAHAQQCYPRECCGLILSHGGQDEYLPCENLEKVIEGDPDSGPEHGFRIDEELLAKHEDAGDLKAVVHSHINRSASPSEVDKVGCEETNVPWLIISLPSGVTREIRPSGYIAPLVGRTYVFGVFDCYTVVRDYFRVGHEIKLPDYTHEMQQAWLDGDEIYLDSFRAAGFHEITFKDLKAGDIILFSFPCSRYRQDGKKPVNHAAVYLGEQVILHHTENRLSSRDMFDGYWQRHAKLYLRHEALDA